MGTWQGQLHVLEVRCAAAQVTLTVRQSIRTKYWERPAVAVGYSQLAVSADGVVRNCARGMFAFCCGDMPAVMFLARAPGEGVTVQLNDPTGANE